VGPQTRTGDLEAVILFIWLLAFLYPCPACALKQPWWREMPLACLDPSAVIWLHLLISLALTLLLALPHPDPQWKAMAGDAWLHITPFLQGLRETQLLKCLFN